MAINFDFLNKFLFSGYLDYPFKSYGPKQVRLISTHSNVPILKICGVIPDTYSSLKSSTKVMVDFFLRIIFSSHVSGLWSLVFEDVWYKWSVDIVKKFCGIPVPDWGGFRDFIHLKGNFSTAWQCAAARADQRWPRAGRPEVAPAGFSGLRTKGFPGTPGRQESRHQKRDSGFEPIRAGGCLAGTYAEPTAAGAADSGGQLRALLIRVVR